jgi:serine/threonine-protein kinase
VLCQLLQALEYAHTRRFVHRDIKPANLLLGRERGKRVVKLADFGLARIYQESQLSGLTVQDDVGGTAAYMPPEQILDYRGVDPAADQYSAAATLYYLLTGTTVYEPAETAAKMLDRILHEEPVPVLARRPNLSPALAAVLHRALSRDPGHRYAGAREFRRALLPFAR